MIVSPGHTIGFKAGFLIALFQSILMRSPFDRTSRNERGAKSVNPPEVSMARNKVISPEMETFMGKLVPNGGDGNPGADFVIVLPPTIEKDGLTGVTLTESGVCA